jgi:UDP-N-acetylglucosamine 1-carboxyvinyltransferase
VDKLLIEGGATLNGQIKISGSKNAALPILAASLLLEGSVSLGNVPSLRDVTTMIVLLSAMGARFLVDDAMNIEVDTRSVTHYRAAYNLVKTMRASILVLGPLVARYGYAEVSMPGGCAIGSRPINLHIDALKKMGVSLTIEKGYVKASCDGRLRGAEIIFDKVSVTGTENILMAAVLAEGITTIKNAALEPEVTDLANFLNKAGASVSGIGTRTLVIEGVARLTGDFHFDIIPDRIEAGTFLIAAAMTKGVIRIDSIYHEMLRCVLDKLKETGAVIEEGDSWITLDMQGRRPKAVSIETAPYPGFPTDLQAQWVALNAVADGVSSVTERLFENRFMHIQEMQRMGADFTLDRNVVQIVGQPRLVAAPVMATDLRASASLVLAALVAEGVTRVDRIYHIDRGYERIEEKLGLLGVEGIRRVTEHHDVVEE